MRVGDKGSAVRVEVTGIYAVQRSKGRCQGKSLVPSQAIEIIAIPMGYDCTTKERREGARALGTLSRRILYDGMTTWVPGWYFVFTSPRIPVISVVTVDYSRFDREQQLGNDVYCGMTFGYLGQLAVHCIQPILQFYQCP